MDSHTPLTAPTPHFKPLRAWIPVILIAGMAACRIVPGFIENGPSMIWMVSSFGPFLLAFLLLLWWLLGSRAARREKLTGFLGLVVILATVVLLAHPTMRGPLTLVMTVPMALAAFGLTLVFLRGKPSNVRTHVALEFALLAASVSLFVRNHGAWGNFNFDLAPRWKQTSEEKFLAALPAEGSAGSVAAVADAAFANPEWPHFRGPNRDSTQRGVVFSDDWKTTPPKELWRISVGPAWSSFVVAGSYWFTQEQRADREAVVCYHLDTGKQIWEQSVPGRFNEPLGGLGPRSTPTLSDGFLYTMGAEGRLLKLRATTGELIWNVNVREIAQREAPPMWGYSCSPLVDSGLVIIHAAGKGNLGILAFDSEKGALKWSAPAAEQSYASVQPVTILGKKYLSLPSETGVHFWDTSTGQTVLDYEWKHQGYRALQPQMIGSDQMIITTGMGTGTRLVKFSETTGKLQAEEVWTSLGLKPDYNDCLVHQGHVYGFDTAIFTCLDLKDGTRKWKDGRYEKGQALLLADSSLILVVSERGELVLLRATPDKHEELAKTPALKGKTWNHPVVVGDRLLLRNSDEAVCYQLPRK